MKYRGMLMFWLIVHLSGVGIASLAETVDPVVINSLKSDKVFRIRAFRENFKPYLDPIDPEVSIFISEQLYDGLVALDKNSNPVPALADYWDADADGTRLRFILRRGVYFHDGEGDDRLEVTAQDVKFSLERILDPEIGSPYAHFFRERVVGAADFYAGNAEDVAGFVVRDRYVIEIQWTKPYAMGLFLMSMHFCKIIPREDVHDREDGFFRKPLGTGPFQFDSWLRDPRLNIVGVRLKRNPAYFQGSPYMEALEYCPNYRLEDFEQKEVDFIPVLTERLLREDSDIRILRDSSLFPHYLGFSCHIPPLDDSTIRNAISFAVNKSEIIRVTHEARYDRKPLNTFIPMQLPGFFLTDDFVSYNLEEARELLQIGGYSEEKPFPELSLMMPRPRDDFKHAFYRELKRQLEELNIELRVDYYGSLDDVRESERPFLILFGRQLTIPDPEDVIRPLFYSQSLTNLCRFKNEKVDELLEKAEIEPSYTWRNRLFSRIEEILGSESPAIPLFLQRHRVAVQPYVRGLTVPPMGLDYLKMEKIRFEKK